MQNDNGFNTLKWKKKKKKKIVSETQSCLFTYSSLTLNECTEPLISNSRANQTFSLNNPTLIIFLKKRYELQCFDLKFALSLFLLNQSLLSP